MSKSYIKFEMIDKKPKTNIYAVYNKNSGSLLGIIKWFSSWRQYCFFPSEETIFSYGCMNEVIDFIQELMKERKG